MSLPRYPEYKPSGVEWLGDVPGHWSVKRIGYYFNERREKVSDKDFAALSVTKNGIVPQLDTAAKSDDGDNRKKVCRGDFVINSRSDRKGSSGASELDGSVSLICTVLRPQEHVYMPFVHHLLRSQPFQEEFYRYGKGIVADLWSTNYSEMRNILLGIPPLPEQTQIAAFLDRETAKIDELVAEQRRLMELLKEKRQAVISHAVTQGLNPHAPMKPSGIEWLGNVPEHWGVKPLRRLISKPLSNGIFKKRDDFGRGTLLVNVFDIYQGDFKIKPDKLERIDCTSDEIENYKVDAGDLFFVRSSLKQSGIAVVAVAGPCVEELVFECHLIRARPNAALVNSRYSSFLLNSETYRATLIAKAKMTTMTTIDQEAILSLVLTVPPLKEQQVIAVFLDTESSKFDTLTTEAQRAITLLQERRTALISTAVTGQIDVRQQQV